MSNLNIAFNILCVRYLKSCSRRGSTNPERLSKSFLSKLYGERNNRSRSRSLTRYYSEISDADDILNPIPKREQTKKEVSGSRKFAEECIELFTHVGHVPGSQYAKAGF